MAAGLWCSVYGAAAVSSAYGDRQANAYDGRQQRS